MNPWWISALAAVLIGHFGLNLAIYNRINATGLPRKLIKSIVYVFFVWTLLFPALMMWLHPETLKGLAAGASSQVSIPLWLWVYGWLCLAALPVFGIPWLLWRPIFGLEWVTAPRTTEVVDVQQETSNPLPLTPRCRRHAALPMNQIFELAVEEIDLPVAGLPAELNGYQIAHLSDIHLTGDVHLDFARYVVDRATAFEPDLIAVTGDIIDERECVDWLETIFGDARASDGCYFVLGNHDTRIPNPAETRQAMEQAGWTDLGCHTLSVSLRNVETSLIGNEFPWFPRTPVDAEDSSRFRLLLSHSPDQFQWARQHRVTLMLAGHTHGGQGRLPLAGPLLSPSFHGSRYASGDFYRPPTTLHVSRGLSGTHLLRINCRPELSLLKLRSI